MSDSSRPHGLQPSRLLHPWDTVQGFPGGSVVKNPPANAGDVGLIPGSGKFPGEGNGNPLQCSCLENPRDGGAWWVQETWVPSLGQENSLEKGMATYPSILAWEIPWMEEPGGL